MRLLMISSESGLNLNFAHLEASGSIILHRKQTQKTQSSQNYSSLVIQIAANNKRQKHC